MKYKRWLTISKPGILITEQNAFIERMCKALFIATGIKLIAETKTDAVNGFLMKTGDIIDIYLYEEDELPNGEHFSTFIKKIPTIAELNQLRDIITTFS